MLIPRVDTEVLAEEAVNWLTKNRRDARVLDLCSGTGCIGCAIADALPQCHVVLADISPEAIELSRRNVARNGLSGRMSYMLADATKAPPVMSGTFDLIVSNPPYIATFDILTLDPSVRDYEPIWRWTAERTAGLLSRHTQALAALAQAGRYAALRGRRGAGQ